MNTEELSKALRELPRVSADTVWGRHCIALRARVEIDDISKFLKNMGAQQVLLISDSCFSGSLTREQKISTALRSKDAGQILSKRSVLVMSSGGEEPVSDEGKDGHSIFAWSLLQALASAGTLTPGAEMFNVVKREVVKGYAQQPQYGAVLAAGHMEGGEYLFETVVKK